MFFQILRLSRPNATRLPRPLTVKGLLRKSFNLSIPPHSNVSVRSHWIACSDQNDTNHEARAFSSMSSPFRSITPIDRENDTLHASILDGDVPRLRELLASNPLPSYTLKHVDCAAELDLGETNARVDDDEGSQDDQAKPPCSTPNGTPLQLAACLGNLAAVNALLDAGADPEWAVQDHRLLPPDTPECAPIGSSPIHLAAFYGNRSGFARLWERSTIPTLSMENDEESYSFEAKPDSRWILSLAAHLGQVGMVQDLLSSGAQWSEAHLEGALHAAVARWEPHVAAALLEAPELSPYSQEKLDHALGRACSHRSLEKSWFVEHGQDTGMEYANQSALIARLIKAGADPNCISYDGKPLIATAASFADMTGALKALLESGADPNLKEELLDGLTALSLAVGTVMYTLPDLDLGTARYVWNETALRLLLDHGASATALSFDGTTPLHIAARFSNLQFFKLLAESLTISELRELKNDFGKTVLHFACLGSQLDIIELLLSDTYGFDINQRSALGWTPFLCALTRDTRYRCDRSGDWRWKTPSDAVQAAHLLIARGANTRVVSTHGWTPLHVLSLHVKTTTCHKGVYSLGLKLLEEDKNAINAPAPELVRDEERLIGLVQGRTVHLCLKETCLYN